VIEPAVMEMMEAAVMKAISMKAVSAMEAAVMKAISLKTVCAMEAAAAMLRVASVCHPCDRQTGHQRQNRFFHVRPRKIAPASDAFR
jgi:hypothetical protein